MATPKIEPTSPAAIWPPAPLHAALTPPLFVSAEGVEVTESSDCLFIVNKIIRQALLSEICIFAASFAFPVVIFSVPLFRHSLQVHRLVYFYLTLVGFDYLILLFFMVIVWCIFNFRCSLGRVILDRNAGTVRVNGRLRSISSVQAVQIRNVSRTYFGRGLLLELIWKEDKDTPRRRKALGIKNPKTSFFGRVRHKENAEKIAAMVAEFAGVSVQHRTR